MKNRKALVINILFIVYSLFAVSFFLIFPHHSWEKLTGFDFLPLGMIWNIFLALVAFDAIVLMSKVRRRSLRVISGGVAFLFYPNTYYMVTDAKHIGDWFPSPKHLDFANAQQTIYLLLLVSGIIFGILLGIETMLHFLRQFFIKRPFYQWLIILSMSFLSSVAIYVGRVETLRLNSWDIFLRPIYTVSKLFEVVQPSHFVFLASFTIFQLFMIGLGMALAIKD
ncbi:MAG: DUF1361 domain-containing protein [Streptococcaceae bacterium]|jgi:uncharacterized membrane protein|nr:DUF1361 domain-containing protein [Streptococcaceae bacterium]